MIILKALTKKKIAQFPPLFNMEGNKKRLSRQEPETDTRHSPLKKKVLPRAPTAPGGGPDLRPVSTSEVDVKDTQWAGAVARPVSGTKSLHGEVDIPPRTSTRPSSS